MNLLKTAIIQHIILAVNTIKLVKQFDLYKYMY